jgi:hypothetical protein
MNNQLQDTNLPGQSFAGFAAAETDKEVSELTGSKTILKK